MSTQVAAGKLRGIAAQSQQATSAATSRVLSSVLNLTTGPSAVKEWESNARDIYLRSLLLDPRIEALQSLFEERIQSNTLSPLVAAVESSDVQLGQDGTGTSPSDVIANSFEEPFRWFCPTSGCLTHAPLEKPRTQQLIHMFTYRELQLMFAVQMNDLRALSSKKEDRIVQFSKRTSPDGTLEDFAQKMIANLNADESLRNDLANIFDVRPSQIYRKVIDLANQLVNLPLGEQSYNIKALGSFLDRRVESMHRAVLVESSGLCIEVTAIQKVSAVAVRPTSFITVMERALGQPTEYRQGIFYQVQTNEQPDSQLRQRAIQMVGAWNYNVIGQNCDTLARWIAQDEFLCTFDSARGLSTIRKGIQFE